MARAATLLAGLWAGLLLAIGALAAPSAFAVLPTDMAGRLVGRLFAIEAYLSLAVSLLLFLPLRQQARALAARNQGSVVTADLLLALGALFCTIAGHFAIQPMMAAARAGEGTLSFGALHAASMMFFVAKGLLVLALAWRLAAR